jgi:hypothetical protein
MLILCLSQVLSTTSSSNGCPENNVIKRHNSTDFGMSRLRPHWRSIALILTTSHPDYKPVETAQPRTREWQVTTGRSLNAVGIDAVDSQDSDATPGLVNSTSDSDDSVAPADRHVLALGLLVPTADANLETDQKYLYALSQRPAGITSPCLVCGGNHRFDDCAVSKNNEYLKNHHIKFCSFLKRVFASRLAMTGSLPPYLPDKQDRGSSASVHAIDAHLSSAGVNAVNVANSAAHQAFKRDQDFHWRQF